MLSSFADRLLRRQTLLLLNICHSPVLGGFCSRVVQLQISLAQQTNQAINVAIIGEHGMQVRIGGIGRCSRIRCVNLTVQADKRDVATPSLVRCIPNEDGALQISVSPRHYKRAFPLEKACRNVRFAPPALCCWMVSA
jgi:hypothetical protein